MSGPDQDPWERHGWLLFAVWLVFLVFPVLGVLRSEGGPAGRVWGLGCLATFAALYLSGCRQAGTRTGRHLLALSLVGGATIPVLGMGAWGLVPFGLSLAARVLPPARAVLLAAAAMACLLASATLTGTLAGWWFLLVVMPLSAGPVILIGVLDRASEARRAQERRLALAEERDRVARDVHDLLGHSLTVIAVKAELAGRLVAADPGRARREIAELHEVARGALAEVRGTVTGLRAARVADEVEGARRALAAAGVELDLAGDPEALPPQQAPVLALVLREAVTNVVRHSAASRCRITFAPDRLVVEDDGRGPGGAAEGNGLRGVRERVGEIGGSVRVEAADPGTRLAVVLR